MNKLYPIKRHHHSYKFYSHVILCVLLLSIPFNRVVKWKLCDTSLKCALIGRSHFSLFLLLVVIISREM